jgi:hypothetical protein
VSEGSGVWEDFPRGRRFVYFDWYGVARKHRDGSGSCSDVAVLLDGVALIDVGGVANKGL